VCSMQREGCALPLQTHEALAVKGTHLETRTCRGCKASRDLRCCCAADTTFTSFFVVWATGHSTETFPDLPDTTNHYSSDLSTATQPGVDVHILLCCHFA